MSVRPGRLPPLLPCGARVVISTSHLLFTLLPPARREARKLAERCRPKTQQGRRGAPGASSSGRPGTAAHGRAGAGFGGGGASGGSAWGGAGAKAPIPLERQEIIKELLELRGGALCFVPAASPASQAASGSANSKHRSTDMQGAPGRSAPCVCARTRAGIRYGCFPAVTGAPNVFLLRFCCMVWSCICASVAGEQGARGGVCGVTCIDFRYLLCCAGST